MFLIAVSENCPFVGIFNSPNLKLKIIVRQSLVLKENCLGSEILKAFSFPVFEAYQALRSRFLFFFFFNFIMIYIFRRIPIVSLYCICFKRRSTASQNCIMRICIKFLKIHHFRFRYHFPLNRGLHEVLYAFFCASLWRSWQHMQNMWCRAR